MSEDVENLAEAPAVPAEPAFLDVNALIERSEPDGRGSWMWYAIGGFFAAIVVASFFGNQSGDAAGVIQFLSAIAMAGLIGAMSLMTWYLARRRREEMQQIESIEELVHLRRWSEAAAIMQGMLSKPMRTPQARIHALLFLSTLLGRYHRFDDAVVVQNYLLDHVQLDPSSDYALRLGRAMAMLQADHLFDADRAIADLRKTNAQNENDSGGLALVEIYRDVKTGHPDEAVKMFEAKLPVLRKQLGTRVGDAYALAARGYDLLGRTDEAARSFERATLLTPVEELSRRYAEVKPLTLKFKPAARPSFASTQPPAADSAPAVESNANS